MVINDCSVCVFLKHVAERWRLSCGVSLGKNNLVYQSAQSSLCNLLKDQMKKKKQNKTKHNCLCVYKCICVCMCVTVMVMDDSQRHNK